ncbi:MAG: hypothetical protein IKX33_08370 [Prevotella sp.]|nr:hypothetical protein [Prevotella sp.]
MLAMTAMSSPSTAIITGGHENEQETYSVNSDNGNNDNGSNGVACAAALPSPCPGHVAELCQDRDNACRRRDGLRAGRAVLQRPGLADRLRGYR